MGAIFSCLQLASTMDNIKEGVYWLFLTIDAIVYSFINFLFKLFLTLSRADIFSEDSMNDFIYRIYQLIGVIMLFMLSYAILRKIVNPDSKDKESTGKIVFNVVKAIILLAIVPSIFTYAFKIQNAILNQNTIGKILLGTSGLNTSNGQNSSSDVINRGGITMAQGVFEAFLFPTQGDRNVEVLDGMTYEDLSAEVQQSGNFSVYKNVADKIVDGTLTYYSFVCFVAGLVVCWMLLSYCISLGFRVIKLAFYEIMAPVCIIASILPSQKEMLSRWIKTTLQVFLEVFIRTAILYFVIYVLNLLDVAFHDGNLFPDSEFILKSLGWVAIIMGLVTFMKSAPDLISKLTGIDSGNMSLGIKDQLAKGGLFTAGAVAGGALTSLARNTVPKVADSIRQRKSANKQYKESMTAAGDDKKAQEKAKEARREAIKKARKTGWKALPSGLAGMVSGGIHAFDKDAKSFSDMKNAASKGAKVAGDNADHRASYKARHGDTIRGAIKGHVTDAFDGVKEWSGYSSVAALEAENKALGEVSSKVSEVKSGAKALIDKEAKKSSSSFAVKGVDADGHETDYSATQLRELRQNLEAARSAGRREIYYDVEEEYEEKGEKKKRIVTKTRQEDDAEFQKRMRDLENGVADYEYRFGQAVQNAAYLAEVDYDKLDSGIRAALSGVRTSALDARATIANNLHLEVVQQSGFTAENVKGSWDVTKKGEAGNIANVSDNIDIKVGENTAKINEHARKKAEREETKKDKKS